MRYDDMRDALSMYTNYAKRSVIGQVMIMDMLHCKRKKRMLYGRLHTTKSVLTPLVNELQRISFSMSH